jgi:hypothetical protein
MKARLAPQPTGHCNAESGAFCAVPDTRIGWMDHNGQFPLDLAWTERLALPVFSKKQLRSAPRRVGKKVAWRKWAQVQFKMGAMI